MLWINGWVKSLLSLRLQSHSATELSVLWPQPPATPNGKARRGQPDDSPTVRTPDWGGQTRERARMSAAPLRGERQTKEAFRRTEEELEHLFLSGWIKKVFKNVSLEGFATNYFSILFNKKEREPQVETACLSVTVRLPTHIRKRAGVLLERAGWWETPLWCESPTDHTVHRVISSELREPDKAESEKDSKGKSQWPRPQTGPAVRDAEDAIWRKVPERVDGS